VENNPDPSPAVVEQQAPADQLAENVVMEMPNQTDFAQELPDQAQDV